MELGLDVALIGTRVPNGVAQVDGYELESYLAKAGITIVSGLASLQLTTATATFRVHATPDGNFRFFNIPADDYLLTATHLAFSPLKSAPVHLGTGDAAVITIGLALLPTAKK